MNAMSNVVEITQEHKKRQAYRLAVDMAKETEPCKCVGKCKCAQEFVNSFIGALLGSRREV